MIRVKVLFICSRNRLRSLTAETIFDGQDIDEALIERLRDGVAPHVEFGRAHD